MDNRAGGRLATQHLIELGHVRIGHVTGAGELGISDERLAGYRDALTAARIEPDFDLVAEGGFTEEGGHDAARALLDDHPDLTAIFAANDLSALGVLNAVAESGRSVPDDVSVVGFDDLRLAAYTSPPLTTVRQPGAEIARLATEILIGLTEGKPAERMRHLLEPELVVRASTRAT